MNTSISYLAKVKMWKAHPLTYNALSNCSCPDVSARCADSLPTQLGGPHILAIIIIDLSGSCSSHPILDLPSYPLLYCNKIHLSIKGLACIFHLLNKIFTAFKYVGEHIYICTIFQMTCSTFHVKGILLSML